MKETGGATINLSVEAITDANIPVTPIVLSKSGNNGNNTIEIEITLSDYDDNSVTWEIFSKSPQNVSGDGKFEIDSTDPSLFPSPGPYELIIRVKIGGTEFARTILVTIRE